LDSTNLPHHHTGLLKTHGVQAGDKLVMSGLVQKVLVPVSAESTQCHHTQLSDHTQFEAFYFAYEVRYATIKS